MANRPLGVTIIACLLIVTCVVGFVFHLHDMNVQQPFANDTALVLIVRVLGAIAGVFMLRGSNWARWLALAWMAYHVVLSVFHEWEQLAVHSVLLIVFAYILFRGDSVRYFRAGTRQPA